jgi:hypothetical protein
VCAIIHELGWGTIYKMRSSKKGLILELKWHGCVSKKREAHFDNVHVLALSSTILLV